MTGQSRRVSLVVNASIDGGRRDRHRRRDESCRVKRYMELVAQGRESDGDGGDDGDGAGLTGTTNSMPERRGEEEEGAAAEILMQ